MVEFLLSALPIVNRILVAGIAITAFSLLLYSLTFSLRERVARVFALILGCIVVIAVSDGLASTARDLSEAEVWLRIQWIGTALLPAAYLHFSDALLASTGKPSRGRRRFAVRATYLIAAVMIYLATVTKVLLNDVTLDGGLAHLRAGPYFWVFIAYTILLLTWTGINLYRAYRRCQTATSRRRMIYLLIGSLAPAMAAFPYLLLLGYVSSLHPLLVRIAMVQTNLLVAGLLVVLAYATAYFGVTYSDRVVKGRLFQWLLRGPLVAAAALAVLVATTTFFDRMGMPQFAADPRGGGDGDHPAAIRHHRRPRAARTNAVRGNAIRPGGDPPAAVAGRTPAHRLRSAPVSRIDPGRIVRHDPFAGGLRHRVERRRGCLPGGRGLAEPAAAGEGPFYAA